MWILDTVEHQQKRSIGEFGQKRREIGLAQFLGWAATRHHALMLGVAGEAIQVVVVAVFNGNTGAARGLLQLGAAWAFA